MSLRLDDQEQRRPMTRAPICAKTSALADAAPICRLLRQTWPQCAGALGCKSQRPPRIAGAAANARGQLRRPTEKWASSAARTHVHLLTQVRKKLRISVDEPEKLIPGNREDLLIARGHYRVRKTVIHDADIILTARNNW